MNKYVRIDWPESQKWLNLVEYDDDGEPMDETIIPCGDMSVMVAEEMLNL